MKFAHLRIALPAAVLFAVSAAPALAQRPPTPDQRIAIIEQQIAASQASALRLEQRLDAMERQLQQLINVGEVNGHQVSQLRNDMSLLRSDINSRIRQLEARPVAQQVVEGPPQAATTPQAAPRPQTATTASPTTGAGPAAAGTGTATAGTGAAQTASADPGEEAYSEGFRHWRDGRHDQAITSLRAFLSGFPRHRRASFARNLIGRALLDKGEPRPAAEAFLANYRADPKGERAQDSLYYLGQALTALNQPGQACKAYAELEDVYGASVRPDLRTLVNQAKVAARC